MREQVLHNFINILNVKRLHVPNCTIWHPSSGFSIYCSICIYFSTNNCTIVVWFFTQGTTLNLYGPNKPRKTRHEFMKIASFTIFHRYNGSLTNSFGNYEITLLLWNECAIESFYYMNVDCGHCWPWMATVTPFSLEKRHTERDGVSNHRRHDWLLNRLFRHKSKKIWKLRVTGLCEGNASVPGEFSIQRASNAENVCIWWRHHVHSIVKAGGTRESVVVPTADSGCSWSVYAWLRSHKLF